MRLARAAAFLLGTTFAVGAAAQAVPCGVPYVVKPGDTLQRIAVRAYGPQASFHDLVPANRSVFRRGDPSLMEVGQVLTIPCRDGAQPAPAEAAAAPPAAVVPQPRAAARPDRSGQPTLLTIADAAAGAPARVAAAAIEKAGLALRASPDSPVAPGEVVAALRAAPPGSLAQGLARPDCERATPGGTAAALCRDLSWSAPVEEVVVSVLTPKAAGTLLDDAALRGGPVCRARSVEPYLLDGSALGMAPGFDGTAARCVAALRDGSAAAAVVLSTEADAAVAGAGADQAPLVEQFALARLVTRHLAALVDDPEGTAALDRLGGVIVAWQADGTWAALLRGDRVAN